MPIWTKYLTKCGWLERNAQHGTGEDPRSGTRYSPDAGFAIKTPVASGRGRVSIDPVAPADFRDQLQDVMALCLSRPEILLRAHLLLTAGRQFVEGDVQHWWLPEARARHPYAHLRRLWLACLCRCALRVQVTGDMAVLDEMVPFLQGPSLREGEHDTTSCPRRPRSGQVFSTIARWRWTRVSKPDRTSLPLMGTGDWNDGMDQLAKPEKARKRLARLVPPFGGCRSPCPGRALW